MQLKVKFLKLLAGRPVAILHEHTANELDVHVDERILIRNNNEKILAVVDLAKGMLKDNEIALSAEVIKALKLKEGRSVKISIAKKPRSLQYIFEKMQGMQLEYKKIFSIVKDIVNNALTESEIAYFVSADYMKGMTLRETVALTRAMVETGKKLGLKSRIIADKHSIGGIAGNRTTPIIVSICASAGLIMPKTSSRAITSAAGTADAVETITNVEFTIEKIKKIIKKTGACMVWGGALGLAPADDKIIQVERLLNLDPQAQLIASILAKKLAVGATHILIDIPQGKSAKVAGKKANELIKRFKQVSHALKLNIKFVISNGEQPIGNGIGPVLEMRDVISVLKQEKTRPVDLEKKALKLSSLLLEMTGKAKKGKGIEIAIKILKSGKAYEKFIQIIKAQDGNGNFDKQLKLGRFSKLIMAKKPGIIKEIDNKKISAIARIAGCPVDKRAGIYLHKHVSEKVVKGEKILTIYAESKDKLKDALESCHVLRPVLY